MEACDTAGDINRDLVYSGPNSQPDSEQRKLLCLPGHASGKTQQVGMWQSDKGTHGFHGLA